MKCLYPDVFCAAILNSQPMGFYQPAQLVRDAREHGVELRPVDVNDSDWDCTLEPAEEPKRPRYAVRLGFRQITGLKEAEIERLIAAASAATASTRRADRRDQGPVARHPRAPGRGRRVPLAGSRPAQALWAVRGLDEARLGARRGALDAPAPLFAPHLGDGLFREAQVALPDGARRAGGRGLLLSASP